MWSYELRRCLGVPFERRQRDHFAGEQDPDHRIKRQAHVRTNARSNLSQHLKIIIGKHSGVPGRNRFCLQAFDLLTSFLSEA
jgi:hypothetical protein